ncbi:MAG TPA: chemotaxis protein CheB [bacterium]|nr:chemotaxis protein CheB [bacterium]HPP86705.1 chemotaxis protein CheB [bacterium]
MNGALNNSEQIKKIVLIGISTGGPSTLRQLFQILPEKLDLCIVVVIHINESSAEKLCCLLDECCKMNVIFATNKMPLENNKIFICSGTEYNYEVSSDLKIITSPHFEKQIYKPSVNHLFETAVKNIRNQKLMMILLTGMGNDGAKGLAAGYDSGHLTVIQDEKSSVIYGMPKAAKLLGKYHYEGTIEEIAELIKKFSRNLI